MPLKHNNTTIGDDSYASRLWLSHEMQSLPHHRQFLTSLIESLTSTRPDISEDQDQDQEPHLIPPNCRQLLLTLHVLFPSLLLPALDLLDRRLVTCLRPSPAPEQPAELSKLYLVRSLGTTLSRRNRDAASSSRKYIVRLLAWNCSCASFALDSFPASMSSSVEDGMRSSLSGWSFGGMSLNGLAGAGEDVPCCKHLLACLLAEKWQAVLGSYVEEKDISKEELMGVVAGL